MKDPLPMGDSLDVRGLKCPLPAMLARKTLARLAPNVVLTVLADDPMALVDIPYMCHREGHTLEAADKQPTHAAFRIRAKTGPALMPEAGGPEEEEAPGARADPPRPDRHQGEPPRGQDA